MEGMVYSVEYAKNVIPNNVVSLVPGKAETEFLSSALPKAILFTKAKVTSALYKSLALRLKGRILLGEAMKGKNKKLETKYGIGEDLPRLIVVPAKADGQTDEPSAIRYEGASTPKAMLTFLKVLP
jgi:hypothetical protein